MKAVTETAWTVQFVGNYFTLTTNILAEEEDQAIENAKSFLSDQHGFDMDSNANEAEAWETEQ
jgi:hypothetical protein